jgi:Ser/Thr protein kinase RdoA (MazF antagonist)
LAAELAGQLGRPAPQLVRAAQNATFVAGDVVIRVGRPTAPAESSYELADALLAAGIAVPRPALSRAVVTGAHGLAATAWDRAVTSGPVDWVAVGRMLARLHGLDPDAVAPSYPVPLASAFPWWQFDEMLARAKPLIDPPVHEAIARVVERHGGWVAAAGGPTRWVLCHGDVHPANVLAGPNGPVIVDWDLLCLGPPGWDHAPLLAMVARWDARPAWYRDFARGYGADLSAEPLTAALTELRLVAATLMRVLAEGSDRGPASEADRRLRYWRGEPDAPRWRVV